MKKISLLNKNIKNMNILTLILVTLGVFASVFLTSYAIFTTQIEGKNTIELTYKSELSKEFSYTGNYQEYEIPRSGYYLIEANGAQGGIDATATSLAKGGYTSGYIYLEKGEKLYIYVGEKGSLGKGGYNGGGTPGTSSSNGYGGGGATDIRYFGNTTPTLSNLVWNSTLGLNSRIMVAAGGGGITVGEGLTGYNTNGSNHGGGLIGQNAGYHPSHTDQSQYGKGGRQTYYNNAGVGVYSGATTNAGAFGIGASGSGSSSQSGVGGGGGGYYGGGAGGNTMSGGKGHGGGGGSSFISGYAGVNAITSASSRTHTNNTLHYSGKYFLSGKMKPGVNEGNGNAKITYIGKQLARTNTALDDVRYIKDCVNGNATDSVNRWQELQALKDGVNIAKGLSATVNTDTLTKPEYVTDGDIGTTGSTDSYSNGTCITIDLGDIYDLDEVAIWHNWGTNFKQTKDTFTYVSSDNSNWTTIMSGDVQETSEGKRVSTYAAANQEFNYTGNYQEYIVPKDGYYFIEANGAQGGDASYMATSTSIGGKGGYSSGYIYLEKGEKLYIYVGGKGETASGTLTSGGYNGGGGAYGAGANYQAGSGGGATDIRYFGSTTPSTSDLAWNSSLGLNSRIMVAAGGGGAYYNAEGGSGGTLVGEATGNSSLTSGGQSHAGVADVLTNNGTNGSFGIAGTAGQEAVGGGGSGYYGAAGASWGSGNNAGGAGGSSFISGYAGSNAITSSSSRTHTNNTLHYSEKYFLNGKMTSGVNEGNGSAKITYVGKEIKRTNEKLDNVRYIKNCINGSSGNTMNHWVEIQAIKEGTNIVKDIVPTGTVPEINSTTGAYAFITDGIIDNISGTGGFGYSNTQGYQCITIDLGATYDLDEVAVWHYYDDKRVYNDDITYVSSNNSNWKTIINETIPEESEGKRVSAYNDEEIGYIQDGLVVWYDGIQNTGTTKSTTTTTWKDLSGIGNDGTLTNFGTTATSGWQSNSLAFDGSDDSVSRTSATYNITSEYTLEVLFKPTAFAGSYQIIFSPYNNGEGYKQYMALWSSSTTSSYRLENANGSDANKSVYLTIPTGEISLFSGTLNSSNKVEVYRNSISQSSDNLSFKPVLYNSGLYLSGSSYKYTGNIYTVRVYNRALTADEIAHNYEIDKIRFGL